MMGEDETATVRTLTAYRQTMSTLIKGHQGRVVDSPGDNILAEFSSVVDPVQCAVEIQKDLETKNAQLPENRRMEFRIGINLGDVIEEKGRIYGDGVWISTVLQPHVYFTVMATRFIGHKVAKLVVVKSCREDLDIIRGWVDAGSLKPIIHGVFPLDKIRDAHTQQETKHTRGKITGIS